MSPQRLCALAVFFSGGSLAPEALEPVLAPKETAGKFAAGAVLSAAARSPDRTQALDVAFKLGEAFASGTEPDLQRPWFSRSMAWTGWRTERPPG